MNRSKKTRFFLVFAELANLSIVARRARGLDPLNVACPKQEANKASPFPRWPEVNSRKQNIQIAIKNAPLIRERLRERLRDRVSATLISPSSWCVSRVLLRVWRRGVSASAAFRRSDRFLFRFRALRSSAHVCMAAWAAYSPLSRNIWRRLRDRVNPARLIRATPRAEMTDDSRASANPRAAARLVDSDRH